MISWFLWIRNLGGVELNGSGYFQSFIKISIKLSRAAVIWRLHWGWRISFQGGVLIGRIGWFWLLSGGLCSHMWTYLFSCLTFLATWQIHLPWSGIVYIYFPPGWVLYFKQEKLFCGWWVCLSVLSTFPFLWSGERMVKVSLWLIIRSYFCHIIFIRSKLLSLAHSPG